MIWKLPLLLLALVLACDGLRSDPTGRPDSGSEDPVPCSTNAECGTLAICFNGQCAGTCRSDAECPSAQYCDTSWGQCHPRAVATCSPGSCLTSQTCRSGLCTAKDLPRQSCDTSADTCGFDRLCSSDSGGFACQSMPACSPDGSCPRGSRGAVCNEGLEPSKGRVCLIGTCSSGLDCVLGLTCARSGGASLGFCTTGEKGDVCFAGSDCRSSSCQTIFPGTPGMCG